MNAEVYIPTRGRIGDQLSIRDIVWPTGTRWTPWLVCPPEEADAHREYWDKVLVCPEEGIGHVRHWIVTQHGEEPGCIMLDDDMMFYKRDDPENFHDMGNGKPEWVGYLEKQEDLAELFTWIEDALDTYPHGGVSARQGNNRIAERFKVAHRVNNFHFFDRETFMREGADFRMLPVMEDFYVTLHLLTRGFPNIVTYDFCWNQRRSGREGGCSLYRTKALQEQAANGLKAHFPDFVKVVYKDTKGDGIFEGERADVRVQWVKAYESSQ